MIRDIKLNIGRILIIDALPDRGSYPFNIDHDVEKLVVSSRGRYEAVILLDPSSMGLNTIPLPRRKLIQQCGFKPVIPGKSDKSEYGRSYWILEFDGKVKPGEDKS